MKSFQFFCILESEHFVIKCHWFYIFCAQHNGQVRFFIRGLMSFFECANYAGLILTPMQNYRILWPSLALGVLQIIFQSFVFSILHMVSGLMLLVFAMSLAQISVFDVVDIIWFPSKYVSRIFLQIALHASGMLMFDYRSLCINRKKWLLPKLDIS